MPDPDPHQSPSPTPDGAPESVGQRLLRRLRRLVIGPPRDLRDRTLFHRLTLLPFLAWVGLGADGLSSSSYGPPEAYAALGRHTYLAVFLALATAGTVVLISAAYSRIIEAFPHGGGGYVVASKLLGQGPGLVSGCALLVDYVLCITISVAAAGDALYSFLPLSWHATKLTAEIIAIVVLIVLNLRGVRESIMPLVPIFILFLVTHVPAVFLAVGGHLRDAPATAARMTQDFHAGLSTLGPWGMLALFARAYSLGGGTYTGLEAVSNGLPMMREPRVQTAKRTMVYMSSSLAFMAAGLMVCYVLVAVQPVPGMTLNAVLFERVFATLPGARTLLVLAMVAEGALLLVAVQTGVLDGPRVLANMAADNWVPRRFSSLSERLTTQNGILLMGAASLLALLYTRGDVSRLVIMFSINVFVTFSMSMAGMLRLSLRRRRSDGLGRVALFAMGLLLCGTILVITVIEKFTEGGWLTLVVTAGLVGVCLLIRRHYGVVARKLRQLEQDLSLTLPAPTDTGELQPKLPTAVLLVSAYNGLGIHTLLTLHRTFPHYFKNVVFISAGVIDSGEHKGQDAVEDLRKSAEASLDRYVDLSRRLGVPATARCAIGTDPADEIEGLCVALAKEFPRSIFFAGRVIFRRESWYHLLLHNQTAYAVQKRLQWAGLPMLILPVRVR